ncbi:MAG TPA: YitT family protein [Myxococcota bacterium]|nr:YitT family protein [Myxococcota bacterium]
MKERTRNLLVDSVLLLSGSTLMALAYDLFLIPHDVVPGGLGGLSMILHHFFATPVGLTAMVMNLPLLFAGVKLLGRSYGIKTIVGIVLFSLLVDFFVYVVPVAPATDNIVLACVFGGIMLGAGLGLVFRCGGSTGGSDVAGKIINRYTNLSIGSAILVVDFVVISLAGLAFGNFELALYGYLNLYIQIKVLDLVLEGVSYTRAVFIISEKAAEIGRAINNNLNRGATLLSGAGTYSSENRPVLFSVMSKKEIARVRLLVRALDPRAFVVITDVYEVQGEGFHTRSPLGI